MTDNVSEPAPNTGAGDALSNLLIAKCERAGIDYRAEQITLEEHCRYNALMLEAIAELQGG